MSIGQVVVKDKDADGEGLKASGKASGKESGKEWGKVFGDRLMSLDVLRGLTVMGMILVTDPGTYSAVYWPLRHAEWHGTTPTDMIFPCFLFMAGVAIPFAFAKRLARGESRRVLARHVAMRCLLLIVVGLLVNGFPFYDLQTLRIPGILQRIAICYFVGSVLYLGIGKVWRNRVLVGLVALIWAGYWAMLKYVPAPGFGVGRLDSLGNLPSYIDRAVFGVKHMWVYGTTPGYGVTYDPEGILSTLPAVAALLVGVLAGEWIRTARPAWRKTVGLAVAGVLLIAAGWSLQSLMPINKKIYTTTFAMFSGGVSLLAFAICYAVLDIKRWRWWAGPALIFGTNAIFAFVLSNVITTLLIVIHVHGRGLTHWIYEHWFAPWGSPVHTSLAYAIAVVLLNMAIVGVLYRRKIFVRL